MPKASEHEIDESFDREGLIPDEEDLALIEHVFFDDRLPQGLHQGGEKDEFMDATSDDIAEFLVLGDNLA